MSTNHNPNEASDYFDEILDDLVAKINFRSKILTEINRVREDPYQYSLELDPEETDAIKALASAEPMNVLTGNLCLEDAANDHYKDLSDNNICQHKGSNGSTHKDRIEKYALWGGVIYQTIVYED